MPINRKILHSLAPSVVVVHVKADPKFLREWSEGQSRFPHRPLVEFQMHRMLEHYALDWACSHSESALVTRQITHDEHGRPLVILASGESPIYISVSHHTVENACWLALTWSSAHVVGCDLERPRSALRSIAPRILNPMEISAAGNSLRKLCHLWTIKESMFKAFGPSLDFREELSIHWGKDAEGPIVSLNTWSEVAGSVRGKRLQWLVMELDAPELGEDEVLCLAHGPTKMT